MGDVLLYKHSYFPYRCIEIKYKREYTVKPGIIHVRFIYIITMISMTSQDMTSQEMDDNTGYDSQHGAHSILLINQ